MTVSLGDNTMVTWVFLYFCYLKTCVSEHKFALSICHKIKQTGVGQGQVSDRTAITYFPIISIKLSEKILSH